MTSKSTKDDESILVVDCSIVHDEYRTLTRKRIHLRDLKIMRRM